MCPTRTIRRRGPATRRICWSNLSRDRRLGKLTEKGGALGSPFSFQKSGGGDKVTSVSLWEASVHIAVRCSASFVFLCSALHVAIAQPDSAFRFRFTEKVGPYGV